MLNNKRPRDLLIFLAILAVIAFIFTQFGDLILINPYFLAVILAMFVGLYIVFWLFQIYEKRHFQNLRTQGRNVEAKIVSNQYTAGTGLVYAANIVSLLIIYIMFDLQKEAESGVSGTEFLALLLVPVCWIAIVTVLATLVGVLLRRNTMPQIVRTKRLIACFIGILIHGVMYMWAPY